MDVSDMISEIQDHGFNDTTTPRLMSMLNRAYQDICAREPWPFLEQSIVLTFDGSSDVPTNMPAKFRAALTVAFTAGGYGEVQPIRYDNWVKSYGNAPATGVPFVYYFQGNTMHFYPTPPATGVGITLQYIAAPTNMVSTDLEASIIVPAEFQPLIVDGALFRLYAMEDDTDIAPTFETYFERGIQNMRERVWKKQYQAQEIIHPTDSDSLGIDVIGWGFTS